MDANMGHICIYIIFGFVWQILYGRSHCGEIHHECLSENLECITPQINTFKRHTLTTDLNSACFPGEPVQFDPTFTGPIHNRSVCVFQSHECMSTKLQEKIRNYILI